jgi:hypothetical protein
MPTGIRISWNINWQKYLREQILGFNIRRTFFHKILLRRTIPESQRFWQMPGFHDLITQATENLQDNRILHQKLSRQSKSQAVNAKTSCQNELTPERHNVALDHQPTHRCVSGKKTGRWLISAADAPGTFNGNRLLHEKKTSSQTNGTRHKIRQRCSFWAWQPWFRHCCWSFVLEALRATSSIPILVYDLESCCPGDSQWPVWEDHESQATVRTSVIREVFDGEVFCEKRFDEC